MQTVQKIQIQAMQIRLLSMHQIHIQPLRANKHPPLILTILNKLHDDRLLKVNKPGYQVAPPSHQHQSWHQLTEDDEG